MTAPSLGRPVLLLTLALLVTRVGAAAAYLGVAWEVWNLTHSALWDTAALVATGGLAGVVPMLTAPLADRLDRRTVMVVSQALSAVTWLLLAAFPTPWGLVLLGVVSVVVESPFFVAVEASVPNLVPDDTALTRANSFMTLTFAASWLVGPVVAAVLMGVRGVSAVFVLNAVTSAVAAVVISRIRGRFQEGAASATTTEPRDGGVLAGLAVVRRTPLLRVLLVGWFVAMLGFDGGNVVFAPLAESRGAGPLAYALGLVGWGLGLAVGAALGGRMRPGSEQLGLTLSLGVAALGFTGMGLAPTWAMTAVATAVAGIGFGIAFVADASLVQRAAPDAVRARVRAVIDGATTAAGLGSMLLAGVLMALVGPGAFLVVGGALVAVGAVLVRPARSPALAVSS